MSEVAAGVSCSRVLTSEAPSLVTTSGGESAAARWLRVAGARVRTRLSGGEHNTDHWHRRERIPGPGSPPPPRQPPTLGWCHVNTSTNIATEDPEKTRRHELTCIDRYRYSVHHAFLRERNLPKDCKKQSISIRPLVSTHHTRLGRHGPRCLE